MPRFAYESCQFEGAREILSTGLRTPRRFMLHVLPKGFMRIRHYGLLANHGKRHKLAPARRALEAPLPASSPQAPESVEAFWQRISGIDIHQCPRCRLGRMLLVRVLAPLAQGPPR